jgi:hypothetical protein
MGDIMAGRFERRGAGWGRVQGYTRALLGRRAGAGMGMTCLLGSYAFSHSDLSELSATAETGCAVRALLRTLRYTNGQPQNEDTNTNRVVRYRYCAIDIAR